MTSQQFFEFISQHVHIAGWGGVMSVCATLIYKLFRGGSLFTELKTRALVAEANINRSTTNCIPTIQTNTEQTNVKLDKAISVLENVDKNIAILVDRGR